MTQDALMVELEGFAPSSASSQNYSSTDLDHSLGTHPKASTDLILSSRNGRNEPRPQTVVLVTAPDNAVKQPDNVTPASPYLMSGADGFGYLSESWCEGRNAKSALQTRNNRCASCCLVDLTHAYDLLSSL